MMLDENDAIKKARMCKDVDKTDYLPPSVKPKYKGIYECKCCKALVRWDGKNFRDFECGDTVIRRDFYWRGLKPNM